MKKLIKLVPAMALLLALGVYTVNAKMKANVAQTEESWVLKNHDDDPTEPSNYERYNGDISQACGGDTKVCGIKAPEDGTTDMPEISPELLEEINSGSSTLRVFLQPLP
ncbi:hypothetical protein ORI89_12670 [Sphingobacterium sp. UT-1RO-CII-1]|uniref:hypothetical protein n=1 Tax=Sphingobacterium sp. UT-1RO-CII-1 TaxID=2995225 RepID=UPI00227D0733|nr:hypothetical protein [Sphingobacterium sp. UT-1RO-CII-1]MCY4780508.1 hypothetical protein [Sphingobacterium sp. UT-1RO-CII-1]